MQNPQPALASPLSVNPVNGEVTITGPDGLSACLTVEAAVASAERLLAAARAIDPNAVQDDEGEIYQKPLG